MAKKILKQGVKTKKEEIEFEFYIAMVTKNPTNFTAKLIELIFKADVENKMRLSLAYPYLVEICRRYQNEEGYWEQLQKDVLERK